MPRGRPEGDHDDRDLEALKRHTLEGEEGGRPIDAGRASGSLVDGFAFESGQAVGGYADDSLAIPLEAEEQQEGSHG